MPPKREPFPELGDRLADALKKAGYWKGDRVDVRRFCADTDFLSQSVYQWLDDTTPSYSNLLRLAEILNVTPGWLLLGDAANEVPRSQTPAGEEKGAPKERLQRRSRGRHS